MATFAANATPIVYTFSSTASGSVGGTTFTNALVVINVNADTSNVVFRASPRLWSVDGLTSISISTVGSASVATPLSVFNNGVVLGLSRVGGPTDVMDLFAPGVTNYGLTAPFGPIVATSQGMNWTEAPVVSSLGTVVLTSASPFTFQASNVPAPGAAAALKLAGVLATRRRR